MFSYCDEEDAYAILQDDDENEQCEEDNFYPLWIKPHQTASVFPKGWFSVCRFSEVVSPWIVSPWKTPKPHLVSFSKAPVLRKRAEKYRKLGQLQKASFAASMGLVASL